MSEPPPDIWADNVDAVNLFLSLATQWRVGAAGAVGLDYNVLYHKMDRMNLSRERYDALEDEIRVLEDAAIEAMHKE